MRMSTVVIRGALIGFCVAAGTIASMSSNATAVFQEHADLPTQEQLRQEFAATGLTPQILCIAGLTAGQTTTVVTAALDSITEHWPLLEPARQNVSVKRGDVARLEALIARGIATPTDHGSLATARAELASADLELDDVLADIRSAINQEFDTEQLTIVSRLIQNAKLPVPIEFHILDRTPVEWVRFRKAYSECQTNSAPSPQASDLVNACDTDYSVTLARARLEFNLDSVRDAFVAAMD